MSAGTTSSRLRALGRPDADPGAAFARVGWSVLTEPGDSCAGQLVDALGAERALRYVLDAMKTQRRGARFVADACRAAVSLDEADHAALVGSVEQGMRRWGSRVASMEIERAVDAAIAVGARLVIPGDDAWPSGLQDLGAHAPFALWMRSTGADLLGTAPSLAVVGSRAATEYGSQMAAEIASAAVDHGFLVLSGGAYGIDAVAHRVAIAGGGRSVAVLAGGVDQLYPAGNSALLHAVMASGAVVAESPPGVRPSRWRFLQRNRLIAAMAGAVVVVEAGARSGALNTANHAAQIGRPVGAVPGPLTAATSAGCHRLVLDGKASLVAAIGNVIELAGGASAPQPALRASFDDPLLLRVLDALGRQRGVSVAEIARRSGLSALDVTDTLALAELEERVERTPAGWRLPA